MTFDSPEFLRPYPPLVILPEEGPYFFPEEFPDDMEEDEEPLDDPEDD